MILGLDNILLDKKSHEIILIYHPAYKTPYNAKPLCIIYDKVYKYIRKYDRTKYLALFPSDEKYKMLIDIHIVSC